MVNMIQLHLHCSIFIVILLLQQAYYQGSLGRSSSSWGVPVFEGTQMTNLTAHQGSTAILRCRIRNNHKNNPVSWIRLRDWHILSTGHSTYTKDERFSVRKMTKEEWSLAIKYVSKKDIGVYVCQMSTSSGSMSHYYNLDVVVPRAYILGSEEYYAQAGTTISLVCIIEDTLEPPQYVFWYHNGEIISYDTQRTRVSFDSGGRSKKTSSRLMIHEAERKDEGNYTCGTANAEKGTVTVYVAEGEVKMHVRNVCTVCRTASLLILLFTFLII